MWHRSGRTLDVPIQYRTRYQVVLLGLLEERTTRGESERPAPAAEAIQNQSIEIEEQMREYEPRRCEICGREYIPKRSDQRCCLSPECVRERQRINQREYRERYYGRVLENNRRSMEKRRAERRLAENPPKEDTIVAIGYAERQIASTLARAGKVRTEL